MKCGACKTEFCWVCLRLWVTHVQDHYKCNNPPDKREYQTQAQYEFEYDKFYFDRYKIFQEK